MKLERALAQTQRPGPEEKLAINKPITRNYPGLLLVKAREPLAGPDKAQSQHL